MRGEGGKGMGDLTAETLVELVSVSACGGELADIVVCLPDIDKVILRATDDVLPVAAGRGGAWQWCGRPEGVAVVCVGPGGGVR